MNEAERIELLAAEARELVRKMPPLTQEQKDEIARLFQTGPRTKPTPVTAKAPDHVDETPDCEATPDAQDIGPAGA